MNWRSVPFVRLVIPYSLGIVLAHCFPQVSLTWVFPFYLLSIVVLAIIAASKISFVFRWLYGFCLFSHLFFFGILNVHLVQELNWKPHFVKELQGENEILGVVDHVKPSNTKNRVFLQVLGILDSTDRLIKVRGKLLVNLPMNQVSDKVQIGDILWVRGMLQQITPPRNPKNFDYQKFMHFNNLHYQVFPEHEDWKSLASEANFSLRRISQNLQQYLIAILAIYLPGKDDFAVASALILGDKSNIQSELRNAYAVSGAMHVLAVSGLHVGMIFIGTSFLLSLFKWRSRYWDIIKVLIQLVAIWSFALVTGGSASVLRASVMFSFFIIGQTIYRNTSIYNSITASAFILLCVNPLFLFQVGFQLSYLALFGIIYFQHKIYCLWYVKYKIGRFVWKLVSVGLAAQLTTFPLSLYYFHRFPNYFWLSGIIVVPAATLILSLGIILFLVHHLPVLNEIVGKLLEWVIQIVNEIIYHIEQLPFSSFDGIWLYVQQLSLIYVLLIQIIFWIETKRKFWVWTSLVVTNLIFCFNAWQIYSLGKQDEIVFYQVPRVTLIELYQGRKVFCFSSKENQSAPMAHVNEQYQCYQKIQSVNYFTLNFQGRVLTNLWVENGVIHFKGVSIAMLNGDHLIKSQQQVDYVLIHGKPPNNLFERIDSLKPKLVIFDGSNPPWETKKWRDKCYSKGYDCKDLNEEGALIIKL